MESARPKYIVKEDEKIGKKSEIKSKKAPLFPMRIQLPDFIHPFGKVNMTTITSSI